MDKIYNISQIRKIEKAAVAHHAIDEFTLMTRAGEAALAFLLKKWPGAKKVTVVCGPGNNGGDGYVLAKSAYESGLAVTVLTLGNTSSLKGPAKQAFTNCESVLAIKPFKNIKEGCADVIVDAIFGIGLKKPITEEYRKAIMAINKTTAPILALDIPSGISADFGTIMGVAIKAHATITFIGIKRGLLTNNGRDYSGEIILEKLGLSNELLALNHPIEVLQPSLIRKMLPPREKNTHKGDYGHVLVLGGNKGMGGAVRLAAEAALRAGAGLVSIGTRIENVNLALAKHPEIMCHGINTLQDLTPLLKKATVIVLGPGLGSDGWSKTLFQAALDTPLPKVIDADGLNLLGTMPKCESNWILTPHPGEAARLLGLSGAIEIQNDRFSAVERLEALGGIWVLKGVGTLIKTKNDYYICPFGNPGMASGGMGDVLSGIIGSFIAQDLNLPLAAATGVLVHALAGDKASIKGQRGLVATDLIDNIREQVNPQ